jgi:DNA polymerase V
MIGLIDGNNFFVSCERVFRPDLEGKPVIVLSNNDGCAIARSNEVKQMGVPMGAPYFKVCHLLEEANTEVFSSNFQLYGDLSHRMMTLLEQSAPRCETYSIDEAFLDFSGILDPTEYARTLRSMILKSLGLPTSIGIAPTKTLAKFANRLSKKDPKYHHVCLLKDEDTIRDALAKTRVDDIWGVGKKTAIKLHHRGIHTALDLKSVDPKWMRQACTVVGERLVYELNGISCLSLEEVEDPRQSIQVSRSFANPVMVKEDLHRIVATYACRVAAKLRAHHLKARTLHVSIRTNPFSKIKPFASYGHTLSLDEAVQDDGSLMKIAEKALSACYVAGHGYTKAGVWVGDIVQEDTAATSLFQDRKDRDVQERLSQTTDMINGRFGKGTVYRASCLKNMAWNDRKERCSPHYTTDWNDLPTVRAR